MPKPKPTVTSKEGWEDEFDELVSRYHLRNGGLSPRRDDGSPNPAYELIPHTTMEDVKGYVRTLLTQAKRDTAEEILNKLETHGHPMQGSWRRLLLQIRDRYGLDGEEVK